MRFGLDDYLSNPGRNFDVAPKGERFLLLRPVASTRDDPGVVSVQGWLSELERLAPRR